MKDEKTEPNTVKRPKRKPEPFTPEWYLANVEMLCRTCLEEMGQGDWITGLSYLKVAYDASQRFLGVNTDDRLDEWSDKILVARLTADNGTYAKAIKMVGNRNSRVALVELVDWLLKGQP